jgi:hypothetical protein
MDYVGDRLIRIRSSIKTKRLHVKKLQRLLVPFSMGAMNVFTFAIWTHHVSNPARKLTTPPCYLVAAQKQSIDGWQGFDRVFPRPCH